MQTKFLVCINRILEGGFDDFLIDIFVKLNFVSYLSKAYDEARNGGGGIRNRFEDRMYYIKQIMQALKDHQNDKVLAKFYGVVKKTGTWKKMIELIE